MRHRLFLLSPAHCGGKRAQLLLGDRAQFPLAQALRSDAGATLGETFAFLSGLYFRGKLAYARRFASAPAGQVGALVITTNRGLLPTDTPVRIDDLRAFGHTDIDADNPIYRDPLARDAARLAGQSEADVILLGSVATGKYADILRQLLPGRLYYPTDFAGRGDMSRGALLLRAVREDRELTYAPLDGYVRGPVSMHR